MNDKSQAPRLNQAALAKGKGRSQEAVAVTDVSTKKVEQAASQKRTCKTCGKDFSLFKGEASFFLSRALQIPKRCKDCRGLSREDAATPKSMQNTFFRDSDATRVPMVPWRHI